MLRRRIVRKRGEGKGEPKRDKETEKRETNINFTVPAAGEPSASLKSVSCKCIKQDEKGKLFRKIHVDVHSYIGIALWIFAYVSLPIKKDKDDERGEMRRAHSVLESDVGHELRDAFHIFRHRISYRVYTSRVDLL